jgi:hypothetical protein
MKLKSIALVVVVFALILLYIARGIFSLRDLKRRIRAEPAYTCAIVDKVGGADAVLTACRQMMDVYAPNENQSGHSIFLCILSEERSRFFQPLNLAVLDGLKIILWSSALGMAGYFEREEFL